jgi:alkylhydroperoxidase family enzyme
VKFDSFKEEDEQDLVEPPETVRDFAIRHIERLSKATRSASQSVRRFLQRARRQKIKITSETYERWSALRQGWRKIKRRSRPQLVPMPLPIGSDLIESLFRRSIDPKIHALLQLRTVARLGCDSATEPLAETCTRYGWSPELIRAVRSGASNLGFSDRDNLLLRYADDITRTPSDVDLQVFRQLRHHFTQDQIVEITASICYENFRTRFRNALAIQPEAAWHSASMDTAVRFPAEETELVQHSAADY